MSEPFWGQQFRKCDGREAFHSSPHKFGAQEIRLVDYLLPIDGQSCVMDALRSTAASLVVEDIVSVRRPSLDSLTLSDRIPTRIAPPLLLHHSHE